MFKYVQNRGREWEGKEKEHNKKIGKFLHEQYKKKEIWEIGYDRWNQGSERTF